MSLKIYSRVTILQRHETVHGSQSSDCLWPTWCFSCIFTGGWLQLKSLRPYVAVYCKGIKSEATRCPRNVVVQDSPLSRCYFHGLTSFAFAGPAFFATAVSSDLPFEGIELADCTETEFILPFFGMGRQMDDGCLVTVIHLLMADNYNTRLKNANLWSCTRCCHLDEKPRPKNEGINC